jgi:DNA-binding NtrC family response regulator
VKEQLEKLAPKMYRSDTPSSEEVREFQKPSSLQFCQDMKANQVRAAKKLGVHRNTLRRTPEERNPDAESARLSRRPPLSATTATSGKKPEAT